MNTACAFNHVSFRNCTGQINVIIIIYLLAYLTTCYILQQKKKRNLRLYIFTFPTERILAKLFYTTKPENLFFLDSFTTYRRKCIKQNIALWFATIVINNEFILSSYLHETN